MSLLLGPIYSSTAAPGAVGFGDYEVDGFMTAYFTLAGDGFAYQIVRSGTRSPAIGPWITPQVGMNLYECMATQLDTRPPTGRFGEWLDLANTWSWGYPAPPSRTSEGFVQPVINDRTSTFQIDIRRKSDGFVVDTFNVTLFATGNA